MKRLTPCLDCGALGSWRNNHGQRCRPCERRHEGERAAAFKHLRHRPPGPCVKCGATTDLTWDHVVPRKKGGEGSPENLQTLCRRCNSRKGDR